MVGITRNIHIVISVHPPLLTLAMLISVLLTTATLVACGGESTDSSSESNAAQTVVDTTTPTPTMQSEPDHTHTSSDRDSKTHAGTHIDS